MLRQKLCFCLCAALPQTCASEVVLSMSRAEADAGLKAHHVYPAPLGEIQPAASEPVQASGRSINVVPQSARQI